MVSDHGFRPIEREIRPNVLLVKAGLLTADADGNVIGGKIATVANGGSFFIYLPKDGAEDLLHEVDTALKPLRDQGLAGAVLDHAALNRLSADPDAQLALDAPEGASFSDDTSGDLVGRLPTTEGTHGGMSSSRGLESSFIAWGPGIKAGVDLHGIPMTRIGPTILKAMRINDPKFGDGPPIHEIFRLSGEQFSEGGGMDHGGGE